MVCVPIIIPAAVEKGGRKKKYLFFIECLRRKVNFSNQ